MVGPQQGVYLGFDLGDAVDELVCGGLQAVADQLLQIFQVLPEGGQLDHHRGQPVEQVPAEGVLRNGLERVLVAGGDDPHVQLQILVPAHPAEGVLLDDAKNFGLHGQAHGVQLVQEQSAAAGLLQIAGFVLAAGKAAPLGAEEEAFDEGLRDGGAVDGQEFTPPAAAGAVDALGEDFLARPRLPHKEDGAVLGRYPLGQGHRLPQLGAAANDIIKGIAGKADFRGLLGESRKGPLGGLQFFNIFFHDFFRLLEYHCPQ